MWCREHSVFQLALGSVALQGYSGYMRILLLLTTRGGENVLLKSAKSTARAKRGQRKSKEGPHLPQTSDHEDSFSKAIPFLPGCYVSRDINVQSVGPVKCFQSEPEHLRKTMNTSKAYHDDHAYHGSPCRCQLIPKAPCTIQTASRYPIATSQPKGASRSLC